MRVLVTASLWEPARGLLLSVEVWHVSLNPQPASRVIRSLLHLCCSPSARECNPPTLVLLVKLGVCRGLEVGTMKDAAQEQGTLQIPRVFWGVLFACYVHGLCSFPWQPWQVKSGGGCLLRANEIEFFLMVDKFWFSKV